MLAPIALILALPWSAPAQRRPLPPVGLAVRDSAGRWCSEFRSDSVAPLRQGAVVAIVAADSISIPVVLARVAAIMPGQCPTAFPQPRWIGYRAFRLEPADSSQAPARTSSVGLAIVADVKWTRRAGGRMQADVDGDGVVDEVVRCAADEGEHFTVWSWIGSANRVLRWHEYFDWGAVVQSTCLPGESGDIAGRPAPESF